LDPVNGLARLVDDAYQGVVCTVVGPLRRVTEDLIARGYGLVNLRGNRTDPISTVIYTCGGGTVQMGFSGLLRTQTGNPGSGEHGPPKDPGGDSAYRPDRVGDGGR